MSQLQPHQIQELERILSDLETAKLNKDEIGLMKAKSEYFRVTQPLLHFEGIQEYWYRYDRIIGFGKTELFPKDERNMWRTSMLVLMLLAYTPESLQVITPVQEAKSCQAYINERRELVEVRYKQLSNNKYQILSEIVVKKDARGEDLRDYKCGER